MKDHLIKNINIRKTNEVIALKSASITSIFRLEAAAYFPFVKGRCHFSERSLPFETVDAIF